MEEIRALSWKQPFANLMLKGKIETRTWDTKYRGLVLICVSKKFYENFDLYQITGSKNWGIIQNEVGISAYQSCGKAIAIGRLVDSRPMKVDDEDKCFVKFNPKLFCHIYEDVKEIEPFSWRGSQGWRVLTDEQKQLIKLKA